MILAIIILAYVANVFLNRTLTYFSVKNQCKYYTISYDFPFVWFIPIWGNIWCTLDFISSFDNKNNRGKFYGKNW
jgi:hypothetical protein